MTRDARLPLTPRMEAAMNDMKEQIARRFPVADFSFYEWEDPVGIFLVATVDLDDLDEITDMVVDHMVDLQVEEGLPLFVVPERTPERNLVILAQMDREKAALTVP